MKGYWLILALFVVSCRTANNLPVPDGALDPRHIISVPDSFSPNGDGYNDVLLVNGKEIGTLRMSIYNRWGQLVFETDKQEQGWDGKTNGQPQIDDTYVYLVQAVFLDGTKQNIQGMVKLVR